ncbi:metal-dependent amidase/aminoacylase/carboxypeptidase family protein [Saonia flava]|uniref:Metal-dependent amidase/aminoacylase/carboxypeptidase family protein n=1 Tax=Saonia flava TaxID=523696 RepID=A0A846R5I1_9FLAO|nr:M20 family metallopeptidase [Saonia flava]NJB72039.1 metal-dependent amidase/aminoacylase/carboxypeptidase family protein [Saonia flava]
MNSNKKIIKLAFTIQFLFLGLVSCAQNTKVESSIHKNVQEQTNEIFDSLITIRRDFHVNPEVSGQEKRTSEKIAEYLLALGLEVKTGIGGHGVVGILNTGKAGKRIAWRADMDAMHSDIPDVVDFQSKNEGVRHICGHDVNTTIALGIANVMASQKAKLAGTVYFIFQPSEETYKGAKTMIDDGLFETIQPNEIYGSHIAPAPTTVITTKPEWMFADYKIIQVSYKNSTENEQIIDYTKELISSFQNIEPDSKFWDNRNLLDPNIGLASPNTIFKNFTTVNQNFKVEETEKEISISTYIGSSIMKKLDSVLPLLKQKINESKYAENLIDIEYTLERANIYNDKDLTKNALNSIGKIYGAENTILMYGEMPDGRGDDFAYYQEHVPGVYFYLGGSNFEKGILSMPHAPNFQVDESCIKTGVNYFSSLIVERLIN